MYAINLDLIKKYDKPGPRYTSYPTAPHFNDAFTSDKYLDEIIATNHGEALPDLSIYFHLPYCDTLCYFCGCNMIITRNRDRVNEYVRYIKKEIDLLRPYLHQGRKVSQLHWGGGTPTHLTPEEIDDLASYIRTSFQFTENSENSCEIDPRGLTKAHLEALRNNGFNRISMGVQDFNIKVQQAVNRVQPEEMTKQVISWARELGFDSINLDLIYGLPFQTVDSFMHTVEKTIDMDPDRIAVFNYAHVPWMKKHMGLINAEDIPPAEVKLDILKSTIERLTGTGYELIGMDHFAKPNDELSIALREKKLYRNFQGYSTHAGTDLYAFGITAISQLNNIYSQNYKTEKEYYSAIDEGRLPVMKGYSLSQDDHIRRHVIMRLMCDYELSIPDVENRFSINFSEYFRTGLQNLKDFIDEGLVTISNNKIEIHEMGQLLIRNIVMNFDGYIERNEDSGRYSKTL
ncbi:MAG: oxygen-independent coproporphyrinogen III oxidase [Ignavibacteria bacterium]|nr:oxygen-independent coproporphyrinogen III oxidase [Ignavibacteria bacterium]